MNECYNAPDCANEYIKMLNEEIAKTDFEALDKIADFLCEKKEASRIFTCGNGGSAATASHIVNDLTKGCRVCDRLGFKAHCLNDPNAVVTCLANDFCYEDAYKIMLETYAEKGDVLIVFSGSGNSENVIRALNTAKKMGITTIGFGGRDGGKMKAMLDICLIAPTYSMEMLEDMHMVYVHSLVCRIKSILEKKYSTQ